MTSSFERLEESLRASGPGAMVDYLCQTLRERKDYQALFYAMMLRTRLQLGLSAAPVTSSEEIPVEVQGPYAENLREAARTIGQLCLEGGDISGAWRFYRMIGEPAKVAEAIATYEPEDAEQCQRVVNVALGEGVNPAKGFDLVLKHYGICSAIAVLGPGFAHSDEVRTHCTQRLVRAVYDQLADRLAADVFRKEGSAMAPADIRELIAGRDWLFDDEGCHIEPSHLAATVALSIHLSPGEELNQAIQLCEYGAKLARRLHPSSDPPFQDYYQDYRIYLRALAGLDVEEALAHFRARVAMGTSGEAPRAAAELLVGLLARLQRHREALDLFACHLGATDSPPPSPDCPSLEDLCRRTGDYRPLIEVSRRRGDLVTFAAGLLDARSAPTYHPEPPGGSP